VGNPVPPEPPEPEVGDPCIYCVDAPKFIKAYIFESVACLCCNAGVFYKKVFGNMDGIYLLEQKIPATSCQWGITNPFAYLFQYWTIQCGECGVPTPIPPGCTNMGLFTGYYYVTATVTYSALHYHFDFYIKGDFVTFFHHRWTFDTANEICWDGLFGTNDVTCPDEIYLPCTRSFALGAVHIWRGD